jgi:hypothetical protein
METTKTFSEMIDISPMMRLIDGLKSSRGVALRTLCGDWGAFASASYARALLHTTLSHPPPPSPLMRAARPRRGRVVSGPRLGSRACSREHHISMGSSWAREYVEYMYMWIEL